MSHCQCAICRVLLIFSQAQLPSPFRRLTKPVVPMMVRSIWWTQNSRRGRYEDRCNMDFRYVTQLMSTSTLMRLIDGAAIIDVGGQTYNDGTSAFQNIAERRIVAGPVKTVDGVVLGTTEFRSKSLFDYFVILKKPVCDFV